MGTPKFKVDYITVDLKDSDGAFVDFRFIVEYNRIPNADEAIELKNYTVKYNGKRLKIESIGQSENKVYIVPDITQKERQVMLPEFVAALKEEIDLKKLLSIDVKPIHDTKGNILHNWLKRDYNQFREYFVQQVKPITDLPIEVEFMNMRNPIFKDQPIARPDNFEDYWMNTPLQKIKQ